ncbi:LIM domain and actin-binding protein 1 [Galdieria sulphuraria]|uniref:LIM zinc-binding domain-containing protein n=1 Tax=Galdieria sulphuraria TaxID=130081 RepID=M2Y1G3_GALSU|nr:uncharacterized protein Gasu_28790 [Galdieria sulphuraria]EME29654.1 hypothetical protein Gasu_28790 [Galdieria sulphuraria]GJD12195.1 LIM domain and actin-binding protein 1 [Galdieria sulphuraria]|eukprot:XP_005706174.1 hypothetical protein Gasu_28790 [Galdieria sulphuraria]
MDPKCENCHKAVYMAEKVTVDENKAYHIGCFRCSTCKVKLSLGNYTLLDGVLFCKPHFHEAFLSAGAYRAPDNSKKTNEESSTNENEQGVASQTSQVPSSQTAENPKANNALEESSPVAVLQPSHKNNEKTPIDTEMHKDVHKKEEKEEEDDENVDPRHRHNLRSVLRSSGQKKNSKRDVGIASKGRKTGSLLLQNSSSGGLMKGSGRFLHLSHMDSADSLDTYDLVEDISVISSMLKEHQREISAIRAALNRIQENLETI